DEGVDSGGQKYVEMRRRLVSYFGRKRCLAPDELADDTLNRVARRLEEEGTITDAPPARYCYVVAKFVFLEYLRHVDQGQTALATLGRTRRASIDSAGAPESPSDPARLDRLEQCLARLPADD